MGIDPTFPQLRTFLVLAEELHYGRAAARMHMTQPPVSRQIKALEAALGVRLLDRSSRKVELTLAGALLRDELITLLARWDQLAARVRVVGGEPAHRVVLGAVEALAVSTLPSAIGRLRRSRPRIEWELHEGHTGELLAGLRSARLDCALVRGPITAEPGVRSVAVGEDELVVALPADHHLAAGVDRAGLTLADLAGEDFVTYTRTVRTGLTPAVLAACRQAGFTPRVRHEALGTELVLALVAAGDGVALVSHTVPARGATAGVVFARLAGRPVRSPILLAWRPGTPDELMHELAGLLRG